MVKSVDEIKADNSARPTVVVVGGGLIGLSVAWRLAQGGAHVTLVERGHPEVGASRAAAGMLSVVAEARGGKISAELFALCHESLAQWPEFARELEAESQMSVGLQPGGTLMVAKSEAQIANLTALETDSRISEFVRSVSVADQMAYAPGLAPDFPVAYHTSLDAQVDNRAVMTALIAALTRHGVAIHKHEATRILLDGGRAVGVETTDGTICADWVVATPGVWAGKLLAESGLAHLDSGLAPVRGQMMALQMPEGSGAVPQVIRWGSNYLVPRHSGRLIVGATAEPGSWSAEINGDAIEKLRIAAQAMVPASADWPTIESWAGLRPCPVGANPTIGVSEVDRLVLGLGHHRHGVLLAPITADFVSSEILFSKCLKNQSLAKHFLPKSSIK